MSSVVKWVKLNYLTVCANKSIWLPDNFNRHLLWLYGKNQLCYGNHLDNGMQS
jgi:hypothetical protein